MHGTKPGQIAQAEGFIDALHDAFSPLPLLVVTSQIGMQPLREVDIEPFCFGRLSLQPASCGRGNVGPARYAAGAGSAKCRTGEKVAVVFQIELLEIEFIQIPSVEGGAQPGNAVAEISG